MLRRVMTSRWVFKTSSTSSCVSHDSTSSASRQNASTGDINGFVGIVLDGVSTARTKGFSKFFTTGLMKYVTAI
jgi:hypothetical protein